MNVHRLDFEVNWQSVNNFLENKKADANNNSKEQKRSLQEEIKDVGIKEIQASLEAQNIITSSAEIISFSTKNNDIANLLDPIPQGLSLIGNENDDEILSVAALLALVEKGAGEEALQQFLGEAISGASSAIVRDKQLIKRQMAQLLTLMAVLERSLRQNQQNSPLQNSFKSMQNKISEIMKKNNIEGAQKFLKSGELKNALPQSALLITKQPESLRNVIENVGSRIKENLQKLNVQQQYQKADSQKQNVETKTNGLRQLLSRGKEALGFNKDVAANHDSKQQISQSRQPIHVTQQLTPIVRQPVSMNGQLSQQAARQAQIANQTGNQLRINNIGTNFQASAHVQYIGGNLAGANFSTSQTKRTEVNNERLKDDVKHESAITKQSEVKLDSKVRESGNAIPIRSFANVSEPTVRSSAPAPASQLAASPSTIQVASLKTIMGQAVPTSAQPNSIAIQPNTPPPTTPTKIIHGVNCGEPGCMPPPKPKDVNLDYKDHEHIAAASHIINTGLDKGAQARRATEGQKSAGETGLSFN